MANEDGLSRRQLINNWLLSLGSGSLLGVPRCRSMV
jgi:hypothetical protein